MLWEAAMRATVAGMAPSHNVDDNLVAIRRRAGRFAVVHVGLGDIGQGIGTAGSDGGFAGVATSHNSRG